jgi:hypothetical protein
MTEPRVRLVALLFAFSAIALSGCAAIMFASKVAKTASLVETVVDTARKYTATQDDARRITAGEPVSGHLLDTSPIFDDGSHFDTWLYAAVAGETLHIDLVSDAFDAYLIFGRMPEQPNGSFQHLASDDDSGEGTNARLVVTIEEAGTYAIFANAYEPGTTGVYSLTVRTSTTLARPRKAADSAE